MMRNRFTDPLRAAAKYPTGVVLFEHRGLDGLYETKNQFY